MKRLILIGLAGLALSMFPLCASDDDTRSDGKGHKPLGTPGGKQVPSFENESQGNGGGAPPNRQGSVPQYGINYHGGPIMSAAIKVHLVWYGNWAGNTATTIIPDLINGLNNSPYWRINLTYTNTAGATVSPSISLGTQTTVAYPFGTSLSDANLFSVVSNAITTNALPKSANDIYFVLTSADVTASSGFCTKYCGWHTHGTVGGVDIKYSFVGNPDRCPSSCAAQTVGPNGNAGADGMASIIAHEAEEAASDPDLNAWYDRRGAENADKCAWTFGTTSTASNGAKYNVTLGARNFLIQQNWKNVAPSGVCAMQ